MDAEQLLSLLKLTDNKTPFESLSYSTQNNVDHQSIVGAMKSLQVSGGENFISADLQQTKEYTLSDEANDVLNKGSFEYRLLEQIVAAGESGIAQPELMKANAKIAKVGFANCLKNRWIKMDKATKNVTALVDMSVKDTLRDNLNNVANLDDKTRNDLKKRKLITESTKKWYKILQGSDFEKLAATVLQKKETDLTPEMIQTGSWKNKVFKDYNFDSKGVLPENGHLHPLMKVRQVYRNILLEMGFNEMKTNNYVESSFWNFDSLFQPQMHPARDAHDTFFISDPAEANMDKVCQNYLADVKNTHENGGKTGSVGYRYDWKLSEAKKNILRTHTTAVTARTLYELAHQPGGFKPAKYFSIDRVFRNETLDATHLAEFHQVEGVIVDYDLTLANLLGVLETFFKKLGINKLKFKPAYNPYTEPSMEVFSYHEGLKKWVEIGNSGMFRPEMLTPLGIPEGASAIAWGLSLERPCMIKYKIDNIRDLCGHKVDLKMVSSNPICRMDFT